MEYLYLTTFCFFCGLVMLGLGALNDPLGRLLLWSFGLLGLLSFVIFSKVVL